MLKRFSAVQRTFYSLQRELLENAFQCKIFSWYGHNERTVLAGECEKSTYYHIFSEYGIVELIDRDGNVIEKDKSGEVVVTGFNNAAMPFIRYRTQDIGVYANKECACGRQYPLFRRN